MKLAFWRCVGGGGFVDEGGYSEGRVKKKMGSNMSQRPGMLEPLALRSMQHPQRVTPVEDSSVERVLRAGEINYSDSDSDTEDLSVSFGYQCRKQEQQQGVTTDEEGSSNPLNISRWSRTSESLSSLEEVGDPATTIKLMTKKSSSFSCLSGAALSANATLANTSIGKGLIGDEILPGLDSPRTFRKLVTSTSSTKLELSRYSTERTSPISTIPLASGSCRVLQSYSAPNRMESVNFLNADDVQTAGGAAGEDRVQAVCSEGNGWLFCGIYDGFNGRDAADFLAGTFYENVGLHLKLLEWHVRRKQEGRISCVLDPFNPNAHEGVGMDFIMEDSELATIVENSDGGEGSADYLFRESVMRGLETAFAQTESDFLEMVEMEMKERPELVMVGSCVLAVLMHGQDLYTLNVGDSRAVLATTIPPENSIRCDRVDGGSLWAVQMTESHVVDNLDESKRVLSEHPNDKRVFSNGRLKGKLKVTRAFGAGYLKQAKLNDVLMGILRIKDLSSPPYLGVNPCTSAHRVSPEDSFVVLGSDGLFDFFTNEEVVNLVQNFVIEYPTGDPAKYMLEQLLLRAAENAGITVDQLKAIPIGRRRKYHDDVTVIVISLGAQFPTSTASTVSAEL